VLESFCLSKDGGCIQSICVTKSKLLSRAAQHDRKRSCCAALDNNLDFVTQILWMQPPSLERQKDSKYSPLCLEALSKSIPPILDWLSCHCLVYNALATYLPKRRYMLELWYVSTLHCSEALTRQLGQYPWIEQFSPFNLMPRGPIQVHSPNFGLT
jgi:hypothetical protein